MSSVVMPGVHLYGDINPMAAACRLSNRKASSMYIRDECEAAERGLHTLPYTVFHRGFGERWLTPRQAPAIWQRITHMGWAAAAGAHGQLGVMMRRMLPINRSCTCCHVGEQVLSRSDKAARMSLQSASANPQSLESQAGDCSRTHAEMLDAICIC
ncbi:unnamed protein product [Arctogadus glacialis]